MISAAAWVVSLSPGLFPETLFSVPSPRVLQRMYFLGMGVASSSWLVSLCFASHSLLLLHFPLSFCSFPSVLSDLPARGEGSQGEGTFPLL